MSSSFEDFSSQFQPGRRITPTRRHVSDAGCFSSDYEIDRLLTIDVSGSDGKAGRHGQSFTSPPRRHGQNGQRGGDASKPQPGGHAGNVDLYIGYGSDSQSTRRIAVTGVFDAGLQQSIDHQEEIGPIGYVYIQAHGGEGGNGGNGGHGQPGARGRKGRDATRYSSGGNGGPGGHGGNAGNPTDGGDAGDGGQVTLRIDHRDQGLLMLIKGNLLPGDIGFAGLPGRGGKGGPGGPGGSSHHWTEQRRHRGADGKVQVRTVFRSNPGGFSGRAGRDGANSSYRAKDGRAGQAGKLRIVVIGPDGEFVYDSPYDLELVTFDVASENTIIEPDSLVSLDHLMVRNMGGMPTPPNYQTRVYLEDDRWVRCDGESLVLDNSVAVAETHTFEEKGIGFRVGDFVVDAPRSRPFTLRHWVSPQATMETGINRPFRQFENGEEILVRFPVEIRAVTSLNSLAAGESTRVIWAVTNLGTETFDHKIAYRAVQSHLKYLGGDLDRNLVVFFDDQNQEYNLMKQAWQKPIRALEPGQTRVIETRIGIKDDDAAIPYQCFEFGIDLDLQRPKSSDRKDEFRCVDYRSVEIRVAERYEREEGSRFLLVANHRTKVKDIELWTQMADYFGSSLDVWDVSYYGFLDLVRDVEEDESLLEQWRGMTIIIPNNYYETAAGRTVAFRQLAKSQFLHAAADHDINFYIVGDSQTGGAQALQTALIPVTDQSKPKQSENQKAFLKEVKRWSDYVKRAKDVVGGETKEVHAIADSSMGAVHEIDINKRTILFQPNRKWLKRRAEKLQRQLRKIDPLHRWVVVHRYDTGDTDTSTGFFRKRQVGKLEIRRSLDATKGSAVLYEVDAIDMVGDSFINSQQNKHGMFLALKFEDKVDRFIRLVSERTFPRFKEKYIDRPLTEQEIEQIGNELLECILCDIYNEQKVARESRVWGTDIKSLLPKLNYLAERSLNYGVTLRQQQENEASMQLLYNLIANIRYIANESRSVFDYGIFPTAYFKRSRAVTNHMLNRTDLITTSIFGKKLTWWDRMTSSSDDYDPFGGSRHGKTKGQARDTADEQIRVIENRLDSRKTKLKTYTAAQDHPGLTYDPELLREKDRVMPGHVYDQLVAAEIKEQFYRKQTEEAVKAERSDLLVPLAKPKTIPIQTHTVTVQGQT